MRTLASLILIFCSTIPIKGQNDTVFIRYVEKEVNSKPVYTTDTVMVYQRPPRIVLVGTTVLPATKNYSNLMGYDLQLFKVEKSDCKSSGIEAYQNSDTINYIKQTDSTLTVDLTIYDNCCYDFLCDASVDSSGTLDLIYYGYGTLCSCRCCFGLTYHFQVLNYRDKEKLTGILINGDVESLEKLTID